MTRSALIEMAGDPALLGPIEAIRREIDLVEEEMRRRLQSEVPLVQSVGLHTLEAGGKRLRPAFLAISAKATGLPFDEARARTLGACMEMIHMATLIHDDVIDHAPTRRGRETAGAIFGSTASILSGDVLLSKAMAILAADGDLDVIRTVSTVVVDMAEGEVAELDTRGRFDLTEEEHLQILYRKTASFVQCCCEVGAIVAGATPEVRDALKTYGAQVGLAFQMGDDLLDYLGDHEATGKSIGVDFREGCATLPLIYLRPHLSEAESELARRRFGDAASDDELLLIREWMVARGSIRLTRERATRHIDLARQALAALPDNPYRQLLDVFADFVVSRHS